MKKLLIPLFCLILIHCKKNEAQSLNASLVDVIQEDKVAAVSTPTSLPEKMMPPNQEVDPENPSSQIITITKKIIKNGEMRIQVGDIKKAQEHINSILKNNKAYVQKEEFQNTDNDENLDIIIRVPHQNFDALINSFSSGIGSVLSKNISSNDVTEEYTDVSIKLGNKKIYLEKYREMLKTAKTTKDMLEIQENIRALEDEIDVAEGRLRFIDDRVNYSTLNVNLYKEKIRSSATSKIGFGSRFGDSVTEGWNSFVAFLLGVISLWPFFLLIPVVVFLWRKWRNNKKK
ncbi:DUF4349 domain-containing protein [Chryseobacterium sp. MHB01]|uniref:DUF4349 domain-containing protein n=1 Tax=Chryseobacterium sp. MHB01 TaxID=3109433 RepID=UPI002AFDF14B|nr:DUF4349 domain-containing protein [Chryseobacterium sp. MHB01]MEA1847920.1 DUF4349 domain-containing protein [Chryseobacterium sp. MHB01]